MTEKELLEQAALAAGYCVESESYDGVWVYEKDSNPNDDGEHEIFTFCPLIDGGDALRLAATLKADVKYHDGGVSAYIEGCQQGQFEDIGDDLYAATRRAIVRAAAEIGRNMT